VHGQQGRQSSDPQTLTHISSGWPNRFFILLVRLKVLGEEDVEWQTWDATLPALFISIITDEFNHMYHSNNILTRSTSSDSAVAVEFFVYFRLHIPKYLASQGSMHV